MSTNWVRAAVLSALACFIALVGCDDNPVTESRDATAGLEVNPTFAIVDAADTTRISAVGVNRYGEETQTSVSFSACDAKITVAPDPERVNVEAPDRVIVVGNTLGESCVTISGGGLSDQADIAVVAAGLAVTSAPDLLRAGETGEVVVTTVDKAGAPVGPYARTDPVYATDNDAVVAVTDDMGSISTTESGSATITATWTGLAGITREVTHAVTVVANVPVAADFENAVFPAMVADDTTELEVIVSDVLGNQNTDETEILGVTAQSSNAAAVEAQARLDSTNSVNVIVSAIAVSGGSADISGTVSTTEGDFAFGPATAWVGPPSISGLNPSSGAPGASSTISGNLAPSGFDLQVKVDGLLLGNVDPTSASTADVEMPVFAAAGDYDVQVLVGGVESAILTGGWTQVGVFDEAASEPNDDPDAGQEAATVIPLEFSGGFAGGDIDDFFRFTLSEDATIVIDLDWSNNKDLDILVTDGAFTEFECTDGATGAKPEQSTCTLTAGEHLLWLEDFDASANNDFTPVTYTVKAVIQ